MGSARNRVNYFGLFLGLKCAIHPALKVSKFFRNYLQIERLNVDSLSRRSSMMSSRYSE